MERFAFTVARGWHGAVAWALDVQGARTGLPLLSTTNL
jgi:hypothetical protein